MPKPRSRKEHDLAKRIKALEARVAALERRPVDAMSTTTIYPAPLGYPTIRHQVGD